MKECIYLKDGEIRGGSNECDLTHKCYIHNQTACTDGRKKNSLTALLEINSGSELFGKVLTSAKACLASRNPGK